MGVQNSDSFSMHWLPSPSTPPTAFIFTTPTANRLHPTWPQRRVAVSTDERESNGRESKERVRKTENNRRESKQRMIKAKRNRENQEKSSNGRRRTAKGGENFQQLEEPFQPITLRGKATLD
jgi:hypothetical protein